MEKARNKYLPKAAERVHVLKAESYKLARSTGSGLALSEIEGLKTNKGQLLIEAIIAISILTLGLLGIFSIFSRSIGFNKMVADKYIAANLAAEGIEIVKNLIDTNIINSGSKTWNEDLTEGFYEADWTAELLTKNRNKFLLFNDKNSASYTYQTYNYQEGAPTIFKRVIQIRSIPDSRDEINQIQVISTVSWESKGATASIAAEDHFFNWRP